MTDSELRALLGARVKTFRAELGLSQEALAHRIDRTVETVSKIERGAASPTMDTLARLADALEVKFVDLFSFDEQPRAHSERSKSRRQLVRELGVLTEPEIKRLRRIVREVIAFSDARRAGDKKSPTDVVDE